MTVVLTRRGSLDSEMHRECSVTAAAVALRPPVCATLLVPSLETRHHDPIQKQYDGVLGMAMKKYLTDWTQGFKDFFSCFFLFSPIFPVYPILVFQCSKK